MKKEYCDICVKEIENKEAGRIAFVNTTLFIGGKYYDVCERCMEAIHTYLLDYHAVALKESTKNGTRSHS